MVVDHLLATRQRINDWVHAIVKKPLNALRVLIRRCHEAELVQQRIGYQLRGAIELALFPRDLDLSRISAKAADIGDMQGVLRGAVARDAAAGRADSPPANGIEACHQQSREPDYRR